MSARHFQGFWASLSQEAWWSGNLKGVHVLFQGLPVSSCGVVLCSRIANSPSPLVTTHAILQYLREESWPDLPYLQSHLQMPLSMDQLFPLPIPPPQQARVLNPESGVQHPMLCHPSFQVPIKSGNAAAKETFEERLKEELKIEDIELPLSQQNYKRKFNNLICWEERTHIMILTEK